MQIDNAAVIPPTDNADNKKKGKQKITIEQPHTMVKRTAAEKKKSTTLLSPFNERAVNVTDRLSTEDKDMYYWVLTYNKGEL